ncbi:MAG: 3'-5' exonuclease [Myxococcota bacterium]|nr:3'-5' exonuclease [Myxococcota bacterium]
MKHPILRIDPVSDETYQVSGLHLERFSDLRIWLFDLEATGLDTSRERITQVAGIRIEAGKTIEESAFTELVFPGEGVEISKEVQDLTGIRLEMLAEARRLPEVWNDCVKAAADCDLWMGQSVFEYDVPLLETEFARNGMPSELPPILDSVVLATSVLGMPALRWSTNALIQRFEVDVKGLRRHDALDDVRILGRILGPITKLIKEEQGDQLRIGLESPLEIKRHPPIKPEAAAD